MQFAQLKPGPAFSPLQTVLYYAQRLITPRRLRRLVVSSLCASVRIRAGTALASDESCGQVDAYLRELQACGLVDLGGVLNNMQLAEIHRYLSGKQLKENGPRGRTFTLAEAPADVRMADYGLGDILDCPHIVQLANSPALLALAAKYIGCKPTLSAIGLRWSFPVEAEGEGLQAFHRDSDDWRFLKVFVYLTDVDDDCGPHVYVKGTHRARAPLLLRPYGDAEVEAANGKDQCISVTGPAGFAFAADTYGIHKGSVPKARRRLLLQFQYSILPVYMYRYDPLAYREAGSFDSYINRLIFQ